MSDVLSKNCFTSGRYAYTITRPKNQPDVIAITRTKRGKENKGSKPKTILIPAQVLEGISEEDVILDAISANAWG